MITDKLERAQTYDKLGAGIAAGLAFLRRTDLATLTTGKHVIDGDKLFAIVQEYDTLDAYSEKMEAHKKYIDIQYLCTGRELVGLALLDGQMPSQPYSEKEDYMLFDERPDYFAPLGNDTFMIFYPTDLHMPCIRMEVAARVRKIVVKVAVDQE